MNESFAKVNFLHKGETNSSSNGERIRGCHVYKAIWIAAIGEHLTRERQPANPLDRYAVAVIRNGLVIGHLPKKISKVCSLFLRRGGTLQCIVSGNRSYSTDRPQGWLEIPCCLIFKGELKELSKFNKCLKKCL